MEECTKMVRCADHNDSRVMDNACADNEECGVNAEGVMNCERPPYFVVFCTMS